MALSWPAPLAQSGGLQPDRTLLWRLPQETLVQGARRTALHGGLRYAPPNVGRGQRVLLLGDDELFGAGRPDEETLHGQLIDRLSEAGLDAEVYNAAVPRYSMLQLQAWLDQEGWDLDPSLIILASGESDCENTDAPDAAQLACLAAPSARLRWGIARSALLSGPLAGLLEAPSTRCKVYGLPTPRVSPDDVAISLDAVLLEAGHREVSALVLLSDDPTLEDCPQRDLIHRVGTRRGVPTIKLSEVNRAAKTWGRGARSEDGQPSPDALRAAAQAITELLVQVGWPARAMAPELGAPPYMGKSGGARL